MFEMLYWLFLRLRPNWGLDTNLCFTRIKFQENKQINCYRTSSYIQELYSIKTNFDLIVIHLNNFSNTHFPNDILIETENFWFI